MTFSVSFTGPFQLASTCPFLSSCFHLSFPLLLLACLPNFSIRGQKRFSIIPLFSNLATHVGLKATHFLHKNCVSYKIYSNYIYIYIIGQKCSVTKQLSLSFLLPLSSFCLVFVNEAINKQLISVIRPTCLYISRRGKIP